MVYFWIIHVLPYLFPGSNDSISLILMILFSLVLILCSLVLISKSPQVTHSLLLIHDPRFDRPNSRILASRPGISKITISVTAITAQLITSSVIPISRDQVRG